MRTAALILILLAAGCSGDAALPPLPPLPTSTPPSPPGRDDFAAGDFPRPLSLANAEQILLRTEIFAHGGMNGLPHEEAASLLLNQPRALDAARRLARTARPAGRLVALCMMKALEQRRNGGPNRPESFEVQQLAIDLAEVPGHVMWFDSDVVHFPTMTRMVIAILNRELWRRCESR